VRASAPRDGIPHRIVLSTYLLQRSALAEEKAILQQQAKAAAASTVAALKEQNDKLAARLAAAEALSTPQKALLQSVIEATFAK